jgi:hypothetical protein
MYRENTHSLVLPPKAHNSDSSSADLFNHICQNSVSFNMLKRTNADLDTIHR